MGKVLKRAFPSTIPVMAGYLFLSFAYGISMRESGFGIGWTAVISLFVYAGSMQFALIGLLLSPFAPLTAVLMTLMVNARHLFYGISMLEPYGQAGKYKPYMIFSLTDETYSLVVSGAPKDVDAAQWYTAVSGLNQFYWVLGSIVGVIMGNVIPFDLTGIDFAMTALFTVIVTEQTSDAIAAVKAKKMQWQEAALPLLLGAGGTLLCLLLVGKSSFLLVSMALMLLCFFGQYRMERGGQAT